MIGTEHTPTGTGHSLTRTRHTVVLVQDTRSDWHRIHILTGTGHIVLLVQHTSLTATGHTLTCTFFNFTYLRCVLYQSDCVSCKSGPVPVRQCVLYQPDRLSCTCSLCVLSRVSSNSLTMSCTTRSVCPVSVRLCVLYLHTVCPVPVRLCVPCQEECASCTCQTVCAVPLRPCALYRSYCILC